MINMDSCRNSFKNSQVNSDSFLTLSVIGKGSYAKVILVREKSTQKLFAMKILKKSVVEIKKQEAHVKNERKILVEMQGRPFLINFYSAFQTEKTLCFVLEYCPGGELFNLLSKSGRFPEYQAKFYAAQMVIALEYLHKNDIIYRDLKPDNVLLDNQGYIKITDFGLSRVNVTNNEAKSVCGTPEYLAPEIILKQGYGKAVDWWTLGSIIYEMLTGVPPFLTDSRPLLFEKIKNHAPKIPKDLPAATKDILERLLQKDPLKRLGYSNGAEEVKKHEWFQNLNWEDLINKRYTAPFIPTCNDGLGLNNFDTDFTDLPPDSYEMSEKTINKHFSEFSYTNNNHHQEEFEVK